jgi:hypothetical protein
MKKLVKFILRKLFWGLGRHLLSDEWYSKVRYWLELDSWPDLEHPRKFSEKIQWINLYEHKNLRRKAANRLAVRELVAHKIGTEHLVHLHNSFDRLSTSVWESLPNQFVLKANHGCGMLRIVFDKQQENFDRIQSQTEQWKRTDYYKFGREWAYKGLPRTILAEELLLDSHGKVPKDYKFFCFHGRVKIIQVDYDRFGEQKRNLFDRNFNRINATLLYPPYNGESKKPANLDKAIEIAETLAEDFSFIRVDLYLLDNRIYFGELTNYPGNGFVPFRPEEMEYKVGSWLRLKEKKHEITSDIDT